ncbi:MAG: mechanosensitive ion channel domain-containing protein [Actinomycetota bacterium]
METSAVRVARPHLMKAFFWLALAVSAVIVGHLFGQFRAHPITEGVVDPVETDEAIIGATAVIVLLVAGILAVRALSTTVRRVMEFNAGDKHVAPLNVVVSFFGYIAIAIGVLVVLKQPVGGLLLGGALTGVLIGIAAQQVLANFFAGIVLLMVRPFTIAEEIVLKSGPLGGEYEGLVTDMGLFYVKLQTHTGPVSLPNAGVLASAVGPGVRAAEERDEEEPAAGEPASG